MCVDAYMYDMYVYDVYVYDVYVGIKLIKANSANVSWKIESSVLSHITNSLCKCVIRIKKSISGCLEEN